mmetsp:Transcript_171381/g.549369  ORF Transcript_171381/g.549369 Transcript_171381/m.549369 type:complete len:204 (-) Transcript_171381:204-815(-)
MIHALAQEAPSLHCQLTPHLVACAGSRQTQHAVQLRLHLWLPRHLGGLHCLEVIALLELADIAQHLGKLPHFLVHASTPLHLGSIGLVDKPCGWCCGLRASTLDRPFVGILATWRGCLARLPSILSGLELGTLFLFFRHSGLKLLRLLRPSGLAPRPLLGDTLQPQEGQRLAVLGQVARTAATGAHRRSRSAGHRDGRHDKSS